MSSGRSGDHDRVMSQMFTGLTLQCSYRSSERHVFRDSLVNTDNKLMSPVHWTRFVTDGKTTVSVDIISDYPKLLDTTSNLMVCPQSFITSKSDLLVKRGGVISC